MAQLKYIPSGIRLHTKEILYHLFDKNLKQNYYVTFSNIALGLKAEKLLKKHNFPFKSITVPNDIYKQCGVAILVKDYKKLQQFLKKHNIEIEEVFCYQQNKPIKIDIN